VGGKIQKIQIGSGAAEIDGTEAVTNCGVEIRKINEALEIQTIPAEDLIITRPIHTRDYESVCNDLLSVDCGLDSISVSVSHKHLASVGDSSKFLWKRLSLLRECANFTVTDFTTFTISPPSACGGEYTTTQYDRTIRNSVLSYANDGQVFTADFQCDYPIDVTAVGYVEPVKKQDVKFKQKIVTVGLSRYEKNDFAVKLTEETGAFDAEIGQYFHMAAVTPDEVDRDLRLLVRSCTANGVEFLSDFGCKKSEHSNVYANGNSAAARFSARIPDWVVEFRCKIALCDWGDDCRVKCGKKGSRIRRDSEGDLDQNDEVAPTEAVLDEDFIGTTEAPFIPMETTASPINEEIWNEQKSTLANLMETEVVFGPLNWITTTTDEPPVVATTELPVMDTTVMDDEVMFTTDQPEEIIDPRDKKPDQNKSGPEIVSTDQPSVIDEILDDVVKIIDEVEEEVEEIDNSVIDKNTLPGWVSVTVIAVSTVVFIGAAIALGSRLFNDSSKRKLLTASY